MCEENRLRLIPVVIIVAALFAGLVIFSNTPTGLLIAFGGVLFVSLLLLLTTSVITAVTGFHRASADNCSRLPTTSAAVLCFAPITLIANAISVIASLLVIEGAFAAFSPLVNAILGVIFAIIFSVAIVYFLGMILNIISRQN